MRPSRLYVPFMHVRSYLLFICRAPSASALFPCASFSRPYVAARPNDLAVPVVPFPVVICRSADGPLDANTVHLITRKISAPHRLLKPSFWVVRFGYDRLPFGLSNRSVVPRLPFHLSTTLSPRHAAMPLSYSPLPHFLGFGCFDLLYVHLRVLRRHSRLVLFLLG